MKVGNVLSPLAKPDLRRLCRRRKLSQSGNKKKLLRRLKDFYHRDVLKAVKDLWRIDLLTVAALHATGIEHGSAESTRHVDAGTLAREARGADSVVVLSAYYVPDVLKTIAGASRGEVRIVLNGLGGQRLNAQVEELEALQVELGERARSAEIRLAFADGVFHTKLYLFGREPDAVAWIGSANATKAGLNGPNEEVLLRVAPAPRAVSAYVESVWSRAMPLKCCRQSVNSLTAFFQTGTLYYRPYALLQMTINPFRPLMETLPPAEKRKIAAFHSDFADDEAGVGAFNLNRAFENTLREVSGELGRERRRVELRRYAIETCYGYWVAEPFITDVNVMLEEAAADKRLRLERIRDWMASGKKTIVKAYASYLADVRRTFDEEEVGWKNSAEPQLFEDTSAVEKRVEALIAGLDTERRLARHAQAFVPMEVPEIWEDDVSSASFADSFFDSLAIASSARRRSGSAALILDALGMVDRTGGEIRAELESALEMDGWYNANIGRSDG